MATASPFPFLHFVERLKETPRAGWVERGITNPESVSDHMYRMAIMVMMLPGVSPEVQTRAIKMALVHDLGESITGDITPADKIPGKEKHLREELAFGYLRILARPISAEFAEEMLGLWQEYEKGESEAAILVRSMDGMECMDQALIYERRLHKPKHLEEFTALKAKVQHPGVKDWHQIYENDRDAFWNSRTPRLAVIFVVGGPGCGKGTQCSKIASLYKCLHLSVGDLLREEASNQGSPHSHFINKSIENSVIIPADLTLRLIGNKMAERHGQGPSLLLLDGFPRSLEQLQAFAEMFPGRHFTISLTCSEPVLASRLQSRSATSDRSDDNQTAIAKRLRTWTSGNQDLTERLQTSTHFHEVDAEGSVEDVLGHMKIAVEAILEVQRQRT